MVEIRYVLFIESIFVGRKTFENVKTTTDLGSENKPVLYPTHSTTMSFSQSKKTSAIVVSKI